LAGWLAGWLWLTGWLALADLLTGGLAGRLSG